MQLGLGVVIGDKVALHPLTEEFVQRVGDGEADSRTRRVVVAAESVAVQGRPAERFEGGGIRIAERVEDLLADFEVWIARFGGRGGELGEKVGPEKVVGAAPAELDEEAEVHPLRLMELAEQRQNVVSE